MRGFYETDALGGCPASKDADTSSDSETFTVTAFGDTAIDVALDAFLGPRRRRIQVNEQAHRHEVVVDKRTHRIRYENETEHEVTIIIEPK